MTITGTVYRDMFVSAANSLENKQYDINHLNVFPVPDGDTGVNMTLTMCAARDELRGFSGSVSECAERASKTLLHAARGNSGIILSMFFRGVAKALSGCDDVDAVHIAHSFRKGVDDAYKAVMNPTEGTILTVMRVCAEKAVERAEASDPDDIKGLFTYMLETASETLLKTPEMLPILKKANVVDAGGYGFVTVLEGMLAALKGEGVPEFENNRGADVVPPTGYADFDMFETKDIVYPYCTELIIKKNEKCSDRAAEKLRAFVSGIGDSVVFVNDDDIIKLHVHTAEPFSVFMKFRKYGELISVKVENMRQQHTNLSSGTKKEEIPENAEELTEKECGFVSVAAGEGISEVFRNLNVDNIVRGGQTMNPSTEDILRAIRQTNSKNVIILPNNNNIKMAAKQAAELAENKNIIVIPTSSVPQGVSAMLAYDDGISLEENVRNMNEAIGKVTTFAVTNAVSDSVFDGRRIRKGQFLGLEENKVCCVCDSIIECIRSLLRKMKTAEFITVYYGEGVDRKEAEKTISMIREFTGADKELVLINGSQPLYRYIISAE